MAGHQKHKKHKHKRRRRPAPTCTDGRRNGSETGIDCGGSCGPCADGQRCRVAGDCASGRCAPDSTCQQCAASSECATDANGACTCFLSGCFSNLPLVVVASCSECVAGAVCLDFGSPACLTRCGVA
jgi:hypothetical protein